MFKFNLTIGARTYNNLSATSGHNLSAKLASMFIAAGSEYRNCAVSIYIHETTNSRKFPSMVAAYKAVVATLTVDSGYDPLEVTVELKTATYSENAVKYALQDKKTAKSKAKRAVKKAVKA